MTDKRYQVFVSSTYKDLVAERQQVTEQLLRIRCIPSGMELFTASGLPPWDVIASALDTTDYMILILAGATAPAWLMTVAATPSASTTTR